MDNKLNLPPMNAFFMEDPDEPGTWAIPVVVMEGKKVMLNNIRKERLDFFRPLVAAIAMQTGSRAYFVEYDKPSLIDEIQPEDNPHVRHISVIGNKMFPASEAKEEVMELVEKIAEAIAEGIMSNNKDNPDEDKVH